MNRSIFKTCFATTYIMLALSTPTTAACDLPTTYSWQSTGALSEPAEGWFSLKDFTIVPYDGDHLVYATNSNDQSFGSLGFSPFADFSEMASATQTGMNPATVAPTLFYFSPKGIWILAYQWGNSPFSYMTSQNPADVSAWSALEPLFTGTIANSDTGPID